MRTSVQLVFAGLAAFGAIATAHAQMEVPGCALGYFELVDAGSHDRLLQIVSVGEGVTLPDDLQAQLAPGVESWFAAGPIEGQRLVLRAAAVGAPAAIADDVRAQIGRGAPATRDDIVPATWRAVAQAPSGASVYTVSRLGDRDGEHDAELRDQFSVAFRYDTVTRRLSVTWYRKVRPDRPWTPFWTRTGLREPATDDSVILTRVDAGAPGFPRTDGTWEAAVPAKRPGSASASSWPRATGAARDRCDLDDSARRRR